MAVFPSLVRPLLFRMDAERAHRLTVDALKLWRIGPPPACDPILGVRLAGIDFPNPVGMAAGADKDAEAPDGFLKLGFGFVEVGTVTPQPQGGNSRPRLFRLEEDRAVINRFGFNNGGQGPAAARLAARKGRRGIVGVNIGANKDVADRIADYVAGVTTMAPVCDYLTVNVSSPNTPGLRSLQDAAALDALLAAVMEVRGRSGAGGSPIPIFLKIAPDLAPADIDAVARVAVDRAVDALIVTNTTVSRPPLRSANGAQAGGLSGAPLKAMAAERLRDFRVATGGAVPLIAAGGIDGADEAYARIRAGATLVQLYSALVYEGPFLPRRIARDLAALLRRDGFTSVAQAVGADA